MILAKIIPFDGIGGAEIFSLNLIKKQIIRDDISKIFFITFQTSKNNKNYVCTISSKKLKHINLKYRGYLINHLFIFYFFIKFFITNKVDVVHSHLISAIYLSPFPLLFKKIKFIHTVHNQANYELGNYKFSIHFFLRFIYYSKISLISISDSVKESIYDFYRLNSKLILNGTEFNLNNISKNTEFYFQSNTKYFLAVGNTRIQKNYELLIDSFKLFSKKHNAKLLIIGELVDNFKNIDKDYYISQNIYFLGFKDNVQDYMKKADYLCMTSKYEGMPITLLESMAHGLIPLVTPSRGIIDLIDHKVNGLVSDKNSVNSYFELLKSTLKMNEVELSAISNRCQKIFDAKYNISICEEYYYKEYIK